MIPHKEIQADGIPIEPKLVGIDGAECAPECGADEYIDGMSWE